MIFNLGLYIIIKLEFRRKFLNAKQSRVRSIFHPWKSLSRLSSYKKSTLKKTVSKVVFFWCVFIYSNSSSKISLIKRVVLWVRFCYSRQHKLLAKLDRSCSWEPDDSFKPFEVHFFTCFFEFKNIFFATNKTPFFYIIAEILWSKLYF